MTATQDLDVDGLWRIAARLLKAAPHPPDNLHVEGLRQLASALASGARNDAATLRLMQREIFAWILSWLAFAQDLERHPDIAEVPIRRPLLIAGFGRTGSTLLHNLLALDEHARAPLLWELWSPSPPPGRETADSDPRIASARRRLEDFARADPDLQRIHPMSATGPDECHWMMRHRPQAAMLYEVPAYWSWLKSLGRDALHELYAHYRLQTQHLQLHVRGEHWLSKSFSHLHYMPVLFDVFPDACVVRLHRHPCEAIPSLCSVATIYRKHLQLPFDRHEIGATILDLFGDGMRRAMNVPSADEARHIIDIRYEDLIADPIGAVRKIYQRFGYRLGDAFETRISQQVRRERAHGRARHDYALESFGLSRAQVLERCGDYLPFVERRCGALGEAPLAGTGCGSSG